MKKVLSIMLVVLITVAIVLTVTACTSCNKDAEKVEPTLVIKGLTLRDNGEYQITVGNVVDSYMLKDVIHADRSTTFILSTDQVGNNIINNEVALTVGDNVFYATALRGDQKKIYTIRIKRLGSYTVSFNTNGGSAIADKVVEEGSLVTAGKTTKVGYDFVGWDKDIETTKITEDITLNAIWTPKTYTVNLNANGGSVTQESVSFTFNSALPEGIPIPTRTDKTSYGDDYVFIGWYTSSTGGERLTRGDGTGMQNWTFDGTETIYARWGDYSRWNKDSGEFDPEGTIIAFGEYPQALKEDGVTITETKDDRGYYLGSDGFYYAKVTATPAGSGYRFEWDGTGPVVEEGSVYYFRVLPIPWRIMSQNNGTALIFCSYILDEGRFNANETRVIGGKTIHPNNYKESEIRAWLNDEFYNTAFNELCKGLIRTTEVDNSAGTTNSDTNIYACESTFDKVFLPSYKDVLNEDYGFNADVSFDDEKRFIDTSDYSRAVGVEISKEINHGLYGKGISILRSPYYLESSNHDVSGCGYVESEYGDAGGFVNVANVDANQLGIAPALVIDIA